MAIDFETGLLYKIFDDADSTKERNGDSYTRYFYNSITRVLIYLGYREFYISEDAIRSTYKDAFFLHGYKFYEDEAVSTINIFKLCYYLFDKLTAARPISNIEPLGIDVDKRPIHDACDATPNRIILFYITATLVEFTLAEFDRSRRQSIIPEIPEQLVVTAVESMFSSEATKDRELIYTAYLLKHFGVELPRK